MRRHHSPRSDVGTRRPGALADISTNRAPRRPPHWRGFPSRLCALLLVAVSGQATAQIVGSVSSAGVPLADVTIEIWSKDHVLARQVTSADGRFRFAPPDSSAKAILFRRLGFVPTRRSLRRGPITLDLTLELLSLQLEAVIINSVSEPCPQADDAVARRVWTRASARYLADSADTFGRWTYMTGAAGLMTSDDSDRPDSTKLWRGERWRNHDALQRDRVMIPKFGFAWPTRSHSLDDYGDWEYPALTSDHADIFSDRLFGDSHLFAVTRIDSEISSIRFCPRSARIAGLKGTLVVSTETGFVRASWTIANPARNAERAGGDVVFVPAASTTEQRLPLLAATGQFWRQLRSGAIWRRWQSYDKWRFFSGASPQDSVEQRRW